MNNRKFLEKAKPGDLWIAVGNYMENMGVLRTVTPESTASHCLVNGSVHMFLGCTEKKRFGTLVVKVLMSDGIQATMHLCTTGILLSSRFEPVK